MEKRSKVFIVAGARPNFMKIAPVRRQLERSCSQAIQTVIVHTGQHYDHAMSRVFFEQLDIPKPDFTLDVGSGSHAYQTAEVMLRFEKLVEQQRPDLVLVVGDVNSTLAAALTAAKRHIRVAHVEAGLRSFDMKMPEEVNRVLTDHLSTLLFATEPAAVTNLKNEGIDPDRTHLVGNVMIDELMHNLDRIRTRNTAHRLDLAGRRYGLATIHRPANVDDAESLRAVLSVLRAAADRGTLVFPVHPRTGKNTRSFGLQQEFESTKNLRPIDPLGYLDFMNLLTGAAVILTDSGGIQVEAAWLGIPCITLRPNTEHLITVDEGRNRLTGLDLDAVRRALDWADEFDASRLSTPTVWDGKASHRIAAILRESLAQA